MFLNFRGEFSFSEPSKELVGRLGHLEEHVGSDVDPQISEFGRLLVDRLHDDVVPMGFVMGSTLMLYDLDTGVSGFGDGPIESPLIKKSAAFYQQLRERLPALATVAFSGEYAAEVQKIMEDSEGRNYAIIDLTLPINEAETSAASLREIAELDDGTKLYTDDESLKLSVDYDLATYNGPMSSGYHDFSVEMVASTLVAVAKQLGVVAGVEEGGFWKINQALNNMSVGGWNMNNLPDHRKVEVDGKTIYFPTPELLDAFWVAKQGGVAVSTKDKFMTMLMGTRPEAVEEKQEDNGTLPEMALPGQDPFEMVRLTGELPPEGILLEAKISRGGGGVFEIYDYDSGSIESLSSEEQGEDGKYKYLHPSFKFNKGSAAKELTFVYEQPDYFDRDTQPFNRTGTTTYIGHGFKDLDGIDLTNRGRLLIMKKAWQLGNLSTRLDQSPWAVGMMSGATRQDVRWFPKGDLESLGLAVQIITRDFIGGMSEADAKTISDNVKARLQKVPEQRN